MRKLLWTAATVLLAGSSGLASAQDAKLDGCSLNGKALYGKVQVVNSGADFKVEVVNAFPDLKIMWVKSFPDDCGKWEEVQSFPDFTIQYVNSFPDLKIEKVNAFPGVP